MGWWVALAAGAAVVLAVVWLLLEAGRRLVFASLRVATERGEAAAAGFTAEKGYSGRRNWAGAVAAGILVAAIGAVLVLTGGHLPAWGVATGLAWGAVAGLTLVHSLRRHDNAALSRASAWVGSIAVAITLTGAFLIPWAVNPGTVLLAVTMVTTWVMVAVGVSRARLRNTPKGVVEAYPPGRRPGESTEPTFPVADRGYDREAVDALLAMVDGLHVNPAGRSVVTRLTWRVLPRRARPGYQEAAVDDHLARVREQFAALASPRPQNARGRP